MKIKEMCKHFKKLTEEDFLQLESMRNMLDYFAELSKADIFIDCINDEGTQGVVVAHGMSKDTGSLYKDTVIGKQVLPENEPIVFAAYLQGITIRDLSGVTQENKSVMQRAVPVKNQHGAIIGVLIEERDYSQNLRNKEKLKQMKKTTERLAQPISRFEYYPERRAGDVSEGVILFDEEKLEFEAGSTAKEIYERLKEKEKELVLKTVAVQEMHHRIKNNLQMIASVLHLQARRCHSPETEKAIMETISRIRSIAAIHELTENAVDETVNLKEILSKIAFNTKNYVRSEVQNISIEIAGDDMRIDADKGIKIAVVINELVSNSVIHGFKNREQGKIIITINKGLQYSNISVEDDGIGFRANELEQQKGLGLELVKIMVKEKLNGDLKISSEHMRNCISFDFK